MVFAVTSKGRVAQGAMEVLNCLPHEYVEPEDLDSIDPNENKKIFITVLTAKDLVKKKNHVEGEAFDKAHYYANPSEYVCDFAKYYDKVSFLVQCMYWEDKYPQVIVEEELCAPEKMKFLGVTDISADYEGSIGITRHFLPIEDPFRAYNRKDHQFRHLAETTEDDILFTSVDHLPSELPFDASAHFGEKLIPFIEQIVKADFGKSVDENSDLPPEIQEAVITDHGELTQRFKYIADLRANQ